MDNKVEINVLEHCHIFASSDGSIGKKTLPLSFMDIPWVCEYPISHQLTFYQLPLLSKSHFIDTVIPNLKQSLSIALKHFYPLAGNLIVYPFTDPSIIPQKPEICFVEGQGSVSFLVAEIEKDFTYLTGNQARKCNDFYPFAAKLKDITRDSSGVIKVALLSVQVTLFPNHGFCIATTAHHSSFDGSSIFNFLLSWASITKFGDDKPFIASGNLPFFDRSFIKDPKGIDSVLWQKLSVKRNQEAQPQHVLPEDDAVVRATFIMTRDQIKNIKKSILSQRPTLAPYLSSFVIVCAYVMSCIAKTDDTIGDEYYEKLMLIISVECRFRLDPKVPKTYFGNCFVMCAPEVKRDQLNKQGGMVYACEIFGEAIRTTAKSNESIYACAEFLSKDLSPYLPAALIGISGSPKFDSYELDFGWGRPNKYEIFASHGIRELCLGASKKSKEDIEIGLSLSKNAMDVFQTIFNNELQNVAGIH